MDGWIWKMLTAMVNAIRWSVVTSMCFGLALVATSCSAVGWRGELNSELKRMGHRNWIVVADSAYPLQSASGIETLHVGAGQLEVLEEVVRQLSEAPHVKPVVFLDQEMDHVAEADAPGIGAYRKRLKAMLAGQQVEVMPHEGIIHQLDADSRVFRVLILKSDMVLPYTSVFLKLDCGYWDADREQRLRDALSAKP